MDLFMSLLELSKVILSKTTNLTAGITENIYIKNSTSSLEPEQLENLKKLESKFDGNLEIIVHNDPGRIGPCTIPGLTDIVIPGIDTGIFNLSNTFKSWSNIIRGLNLKVDKVGDIFNVSSDTKVIVYIPKWFLSNQIMKGNRNTLDFTDNSRIGLILHEIGHWETLDSIFYLLSSLVKILGMFLFFYGLTNLYKSKSESKVIESKDIIKLKEESINNRLVLQNIIYTISGLIFFVIVSKLFAAQSEIGSDNFSSHFGYGENVAEFVEFVDAKSVNPNKTFTSVFSIIEELIARVKTGYPSLNWRFQNLVLSENEEYLTEFDFSLFINPFKIFLDKLNTILSKLTPLKNIRQIENIQIVKYKHSRINENIDLLINVIK